jgi:hypothetical protein
LWNTSKRTYKIIVKSIFFTTSVHVQNQNLYGSSIMVISGIFIKYSILEFWQSIRGKRLTLTRGNQKMNLRKEIWIRPLGFA